MSTGTNKERITTNNGIINDNNSDLNTLKTKINALPTSGDTTATANDILAGKTAVSKGVRLTGTMQPGIDTSDATAIASNIASGKTAYVKGRKITGTLPEKLNEGSGPLVKLQLNGTNNLMPYIRPVATTTIVYPQASFFTNIPFSQVAPLVGATPEKIKKDEVICGVTGTYEGTNTPDWAQIGYSSAPQALLDDFAYSKNIYDNWDSSLTSMSQKYQYNNYVVYFPLVDTNKVTNMQYAFNYCSRLITMPQLDTSNVINMSSMFMQCTFLKVVPILNTSKVTNMSSMFSQCGWLTDESLNNILQMCANSAVTSNKTLKYIGLSSTQATTCQSLSNWDAFVEAGWTSGY